MQRLVLVGLVASALALSGCSGQAPDAEPAVPTPVDGMTIVGLVQNQTFVPVAGASVTLRVTNETRLTDAGGLFRFEGLPLSFYLVDVRAPGFENQTLTVEPQPEVSLSVVLDAPVPLVPEPVTVHYEGFFQCAFEALIIPGACDILLDEAGQSVFEDRSSFDTGVATGWSTVVVDVVFAPSPALDGLRVTVRGKSDADQLASYEQYGRFHDAASFSFRIEPGQTYPDGQQAVPANATALRFEVYPQGFGYHALCSDPVPEEVPQPFGCPLGVGVAQNVQFDLYMTTFYVEPAPDGFSLLG